jgi:hypothetical protein
MLHHYLENGANGDHWAVSSSAEFLPGQRAWVLVQLQENGEQARVTMTAEEAEKMAAALLAHAAKVRDAKPIFLDWTEEEIMELDEEAQKRYRDALRIQSGGSRREQQE